METTQNRPIYKAAAIISYIIGFIYLKYMCFGDSFCRSDFFRMHFGLRILIFAVIFVICTELFAHKLGITYKALSEKNNSKVEPFIYMICIALQSISLAVWHYHDDWEFIQLLFWHFTIIYYVLARTGSLAAGRSGILFLLDCFQGFFTIPLSNIGLRFTSIFKKNETDKSPDETISKKSFLTLQHVITITISLFIALIVCLIAYSQLADASKTFGKLGDKMYSDVIEFINKGFFSSLYDNIACFLFSIPISWYLFSLVAGGFKKGKPYCTDTQFEAETSTLHRLPNYSAFIIIGSVCILYTVFLATSVYDFIYHKGLFAATAHEASVRAVGSFYNLINVVLLNFAILAGSCIFSKKALWEEKISRILVTILFAFAFCFAVLAACNLCGVYIALFGITPRRILSSWVVMNIIIWCILMIIRFYKKIPAAQYGIILAAVSFSIIVCFKF